MKLLLIEDEQELANSIQSYLTGNNFVCEWANNVKSAVDKISIYDYDCILLDLTLPDGNGFEIIKALKKQNKTEGVIIISAKETLETRIEGFNLGADDYLTKPFHLSELLVRIQALIRRKNFKGNNLVSYNEIEIDILSKTVKIKSKKIDITKKEIDLLLYLIGNENKVLSKSAIAEHLSGDMADMLDNHDFVYALFLNAIRHNINDGRILVKLSNQSLIFSNSGQLQPLVAHNLFNRFSKSNPSTQGNGLGLAIIKKIANLNNWTISYSFADNLHIFSVTF